MQYLSTRILLYVIWFLSKSFHILIIAFIKNILYEIVNVIMYMKL